MAVPAHPRPSSRQDAPARQTRVRRAGSAPASLVWQIRARVRRARVCVDQGVPVLAPLLAPAPLWALLLAWLLRSLCVGLSSLAEVVARGIRAGPALCAPRSSQICMPDTVSDDTP